MIVSRDIESPRGGWKLTVEQTGVTITAPFYTILRRKVASHMKANGIPLGDNFDGWCQDAACRESGHGRPFCGEAEAQPVHGKRPHLNLAMAKRFMQTIWAALMDRQFVEPEEVVRRVSICVNECPLATSIGGCSTGCSWLFRKADRVLADRIIPVPKKKEFCGACGCSTRHKALLLNSTLDRAEEGNRPDYWEGCWRNDVTPDHP